MNITQINKRIADMQYCMRQEADKALDNDATYRTCKDEYDSAVKAWIVDKSSDNHNAVQCHEENLRTVFDSIVKPINQRYKAHMTKLHAKKMKLESK